MPTVYLYEITTAASLDPQYPTGETTHREAVLVVERALAAEGLLDEGYVDGSFGTRTIDAYAAWQRALGYSGDAADGIPGVESLRELGRQHGFTVIDR